MSVISKIFFFVLLGIFLTGCRLPGETPYVIYPTIDDAKANGAFRRGWLPDWLPSDAYEIHEYHDLDTNARAFSFRVSSQEGFSMPELCRESDDFDGPALKTKLFPPNFHRANNIQVCYDLFVVVDRQGVIHAWGNRF